VRGKERRGGGERSWTGERKGRIAEKADSVKRQILWQKTQMELIYVADAMEEENERQREREREREKHRTLFAVTERKKIR
jgi:hypothetical protein